MRTKFCGLNFRVVPSKCICGSLFLWGANFHSRTHTLYSKMLSNTIHVFAFLTNISMHSNSIHATKEGRQYTQNLKPPRLHLVTC